MLRLIRLFNSATGIYFLSLFLLIGVSLSVQAEWRKQQQDIMGTRVTVELWSEDPTLARSCSQSAFDEIHRIDRLMSPYKENSEISRVNRNAFDNPVKVSNELYGLINKAVHISVLSQGAFDITFASIGYYYDYRQKKQPSQQTIVEMLPAVNYQQLKVTNQSIQFNQSGMRIDLGGIAKGHAVDQAIVKLKKCGIGQALVSAGGDSRILGDHQGREWMIGIQHPRQKGQVALSIPLSDSAISTSGDYERYFLSSGQRIHHIINPKTGKSADKSWSATVIGGDATTTDALSTTVFILGAQKGLELINSLDGFEAIIIDATAVTHYSSGLQRPES